MQNGKLFDGFVFPIMLFLKLLGAIIVNTIQIQSIAWPTHR